MRIQRVLVASLFVLVAACGSDGEGDTNLATVFPTTGYTGTSQTVLISGNKTEWEDGSSVSFGAGVVVESTMVIGPSSILANIRVENGAEVGGREVVVDDDSLQNGFSVAESLAVSETVGTTAQGSVLTITIDSQNPTSVFDSTQTGDGLFTPISYPNFNVEVGGGDVVVEGRNRDQHRQRYRAFSRRSVTTTNCWWTAGSSTRFPLRRRLPTRPT